MRVERGDSEEAGQQKKWDEAIGETRLGRRF